jgi:hypothetical protein
MTAHWESVLTQISEKQCRYQDFMQPLVGTLYQLIDQARSTPVRQFRGLVAPGGAKNRSAKASERQKSGRRCRAAAAITRRRPRRPFPAAAVSPPDWSMVYTKQPGRGTIAPQNGGAHCPSRCLAYFSHRR